MVDWGLLATHKGHMGWLSVSLDAVHDIPAASEILRVPPNAAPFLKHRQRISVLDGFGWFWMVLVCVCGSCHVVYQSLSEFILFVGQKSWPVSPIHFHHGFMDTHASGEESPVSQQVSPCFTVARNHW